MKKLLMLAAIASTALAAHALDDTEYYLDRSAWTPTACSAHSSGALANMFDDNLSTFWHQNWSQAVENKFDGDVRPFHWFAIDLGTTETFHGFDYWRRQDNTNGQFLSGKIYVSDSPFAAFASHVADETVDETKVYYNDASNVAVAEFSFNYDSNPNGVRECRFDNPATGRYVLVIISDAGADKSGRHACGAEFKLVGTKSADLTDRESLDRSAWTVTTCSVYDSEGPAAMMFDDNLSTYWHQNWSSDTSLENFHWFVIDMQTSQDVDGFEYWRRQNNQNGQFYKGKVYVSDEDFAFAAGNHADVKTYCNNLDNVPAAEFTFDYSSNADAARVCEFEQTQHGRYVLVVISDAGVAQGGKHACCAEFKLFKDTNSTLKARWFEGIAAAKALAEKYRNMANLIPGGLPATDLHTGLNDANIDGAIAAKNTELQEFVNAFNGKQILIQAGERRSNAYLTAIAKGNEIELNTKSAVSPDAVWEIKAVDGGFRLYNRTTGYYIGTNNHATAAGQAQTYTPQVANTNYVAFVKSGTTNFLDIDPQSSVLGQWNNIAEGGGSWIVSLANSGNYNYAEPEVSTEDAPKYYRIVSARWMHRTESPNLAVNGENQNGNGNGEQTSRATASVPGIYWRIESTEGEEGAVKLVNLTGYELTYEGSNAVTMSDSGSTFYLLKQTANEFNGINAYAISNTSPITNSSCLDAANNGQAMVCWSPVRDNPRPGNNNNGSAWYFILAGDAEIATATQTYINGVKERMVTPDENLSVLFGSKFTESLASIYTDYEETIPSLNEAKTRIPATINAAVKAKISELANRHFLIRNKNANYSNCYLTVNDNNVTAPTDDATGLNAVWSFVPQGEGNSFLMTSLGHGGSINYTTTANVPVPVTDEGMPYSIAYNAMVPGFSFSLILPEEITTETHRYALHQSNNTTVCKWQTDNIAGSHWMLEVLDNAEVNFTLEGDVHTISLGEGVTFNGHESAAGHQLTISKLSETDPAASLPADIELFAVEPQDGTYTLDASHFTDGSAQITRLPAGSYTLTAPAGMFLVNGKPSAALSSTLKVKDNGTVTGIDEITATDVATPAAIYDLQGRKLAAPAKGINIINGKKVLVK